MDHVGPSVRPDGVPDLSPPADSAPFAAGQVDAPLADASMPVAKGLGRELSAGGVSRAHADAVLASVTAIPRHPDPGCGQT